MPCTALTECKTCKEAGRPYMQIRGERCSICMEWVN